MVSSLVPPADADPTVTDEIAAWVHLTIQKILEGDIVTGIYACRRALQLAPDRADLWMSLIFCLDLHPTASETVRKLARRDFNTRIIRPLHDPASVTDWQFRSYRRDPDKRLRVGYVSADFGCHSAAVGFGQMILGADPVSVEQYLYSARKEAPDPITEAFMDKADAWRDVSMVGDEQLASLMAADQLDIAVDLAGYSSGNRILAFARRVAPVQITGWGHATGTDLDCFDYTVSDRIVCPPELDSMAETLIYLPCVLGYVPSEVIPLAVPDGPITFGYLGRGGKLSSTCLSAWADILHAVPGSRLLLKDSLWETPEGRARVLLQLVALGIGTDRIVFRGTTPHTPHLATYNEVDVHLDSFPHGGGITTLDACWMGCPTVTMLGTTAPGRSGASILTTLGYGARVVNDPSEYVRLAVEMALGSRGGFDLPGREDMRQRMMSAPICDRKAYASGVERAYREVWRRWCQERPR